MSDRWYELMCRLMGVGMIVIGWSKMEINGPSYPYPHLAEPVVFIRCGLIFLALGWLCRRLYLRPPQTPDSET